MRSRAARNVAIQRGLVAENIEDISTEGGELVDLIAAPWVFFNLLRWEECFPRLSTSQSGRST